MTHSFAQSGCRVCLSVVYWTGRKEALVHGVLMGHRKLSLLRPFQATLDGAPVHWLASGTVRGLLAFLVVEADSPHPREMVAALLWPEQPARSLVNPAPTHVHRYFSARPGSPGRPSHAQLLAPATPAVPRDRQGGAHPTVNRLCQYLAVRTTAKTLAGAHTRHECQHAHNHRMDDREWRCGG